MLGGLINANSLNDTERGDVIGNLEESIDTSNTTIITVTYSRNTIVYQQHRASCTANDFDITVVFDQTLLDGSPASQNVIEASNRAAARWSKLLLVIFQIREQLTI